MFKAIFQHGYEVTVSLKSFKRILIESWSETGLNNGAGWISHLSSQVFIDRSDFNSLTIYLTDTHSRLHIPYCVTYIHLIYWIHNTTVSRYFEQHLKIETVKCNKLNWLLFKKSQNILITVWLYRQLLIEQVFFVMSAFLLPLFYINIQSTITDLHHLKANHLTFMFLTWFRCWQLHQ